MNIWPRNELNSKNSFIYLAAKMKLLKEQQDVYGDERKKYYAGKPQVRNKQSKKFSPVIVGTVLTCGNLRTKQVKVQL